MRSGLAPSRLELEITETVLIDDFGRTQAVLRRLKSLVVKIAVDDFGTGYSSLSFLQSFPFDEIKIDRSFVRDLDHNHNNAAIFCAVITLARSHNLPVLAEGVETEAERAILKREGCKQIQGYLVGRPLPISNYDVLVGATMRHGVAIVATRQVPTAPFSKLSSPTRNESERVNAADGVLVFAASKVRRIP